MKYKEIEQYFEDNKLDKLLETYQPCFETIEEIKTNMKLGVYHYSEEVIRGLNEATASYVSLLLPFTIAETNKMNTEKKYFVKASNKIREHGEKVNATVLNTEASAFVNNFRRVRNLFEAYVKSAEQIINTLQSILKALEKEKYTIKKGID